MDRLPGTVEVKIDPIDYNTETSTATTTSPIDALAIFGNAIGDISSARIDIATRKLKGLEEQQKLEEEATKQKILEDAKANKIVADNSAALFANDALVRLSKVANETSAQLTEWQNPTDPGTAVAKIMENALISFTEGFSGVKLKSKEEHLQETFASATTQIGTINASIGAIKSGAEATKHVVNDATLQNNLRLASNLLDSKMLDERDAIMAANTAAIKAMADGIKPAMDALTMYHNQGFAERQFQVMKEERARDNLRADQQMQMSKEEFAFRKDEAAKDNARQDEAAGLSKQRFNLAIINESQDTMSRLDKQNKELEAQKLDEARIGQYRAVIERVGAQVNLHENPVIALEQLTRMRKSKNPQERRVVEALDTYVMGMDTQKNMGLANMQHFDVHGYTPWEAMLNDTMFPFPGMHPEEKGVIDFQKRQLELMQVPQPKMITTTGPNGEIKTVKSSVLEAPFAHAKNDPERAFIYDNEIDKKVRELQSNVEVGGKDNIYAPPALGSLESIGQVKNTRFFQDVLKAQIAAGETEFKASDIVDKALAARKAGIIAPKELMPTLSLIFSSVVLQNNIVRNFVGHGLPAQTTYNVTEEHPVSGIPIRYDLHDDASLSAYIATKEYESNRGLIRKYGYDATGMHKNWLEENWLFDPASDKEREAAGMKP